MDWKLGRRRRELAEARARVQELLRAHRGLRRQVERLQAEVDDRDRVHAETVLNLAELAECGVHATLPDRIRELIQKERRLRRVHAALTAPPEADGA